MTAITPQTTNSKKAIIIRPGALGDLLVAMPVLRLLRDVADCAQITLLASAGRGKLLVRPDWADLAYDWDSALFSEVYTKNPYAPVPERLAAIFADADVVLSFTGSGDESRVVSRLKFIAPHARIHHSPAIPDSPGTSIMQTLYDTAGAFCEQNGMVPTGQAAQNRSACMAANLVIHERSALQVAEPYFVVHPGSGSKRKNWPVERFAALAKKLLAMQHQGRPVFSAMVVTAGEADEGLGNALAGAVEGAVLCNALSLKELSAVLSGAVLYVGNDSGVSHLAACVEQPDGRRPVTVALFGPTDAQRWRPKNTHVISAGGEMTELDGGEVWRNISEFLTEFLLKH